MAEGNFRTPGPINFEENVSTEWNKFKKLFEVFVKATRKASELTDEVKIAMLLNLMGEKAVDIFDSFSLTEANRKDYKKVIEAFDSYCSPKKYIIYERFKFHSRTQQAGESFDSYLRDITKQSYNCDFNNTDEDITTQMIRDRIVMGINSIEVQERLLRIENLTLAKAIEFCRIAEATHVQAQELQRSQAVNEMRRTSQKKNNGKYKQQTSKIIQGDRGSIKNCNKCSFSHKPKACPAFGKRCKICNKINHFSYVCKQKKIHELNKKDENVVENEHLFDLNNLYISSLQIDNISKNTTRWFKKLTIQNIEIDFKIDTGSEVNVLPVNIFKKYFVEFEIKPFNLILEAYGGTRVEVLGCVDLEIKNKMEIMTEKFVIANVETVPILGLSACLKLKIIKNIDEIKFGKNLKGRKIDIIEKEMEKMKRKFIEENKEVFVGLGCFPEKCQIYLKPNCSPVVKGPRRIPLALKEKVRVKLSEMEKANIIEAVNYPTDWVHNLVIIEKPDKSVRLCLDPRDLNVNLKKEPYEIPRLEDVTSKLNGMEYFTVIDLKDGFWQVPLTESSTNLCTFSTPFGCFKFLRLPFGLNFAPELFQKLNSKYFGNLPGVFIYFDDVLVYGKTKQEHDENLNKVMTRARKLNIKFNPQKLQYCLNEVKYLGYVFGKTGVKIDPDRIKAIEVMKEPANKTELQRFLGFVNYLRNFIQNMSELTAPLRKLLKNETEYVWLPVHSKAFNDLKKVIAKAPTLRNFSETLPIVIQTDASKDGIGSCLMQGDQPICYASKSLSSCEKNYAQIEKELLAIIFACQKFHNYIYGRKVTILTDHKPLVSLLSKLVSEIPSNRLQRMKLKLLKYDLIIQHIPGKLMYIADTLSRNFDQLDNEEVDKDLNEVVHSLNISDNRKQEIQKFTEEDEELNLLKEMYLKGWPRDRAKVPNEIKKYWQIKDDIYVENNLLFFQNRIIIPRMLRRKILNILHESHMGITKTKEAAKATVYWHKINEDIENFIIRCRVCEKYQPSKPKLPLIPHEIPDIPFNKVACDLFEYKKLTFLVLVDYYSKWIELKQLKDKSAHSVIKALKAIFSSHGIPEKIIADNVPFNSFECHKFAEEWNTSICTSSPRYPRSNGLAERGVFIGKSLLRKCEEDRKDIESALLAYRNTKISGLSYTPSQLLMNRTLRTKLPVRQELLKPQVPSNAKQDLIQNQMKYKNYHDNKIRCRQEKSYQSEDNVTIQRNKIWEPAKVINSHPSPRSFIIQSEDGRVLRRNELHLRPSPFEPQIMPNSDENEIIDSNRYNTKQTSTSTPSQGSKKQIDSDINYTTKYGRMSENQIA